MILDQDSTLRMKNADPVISFVNLRRLIGILGMLLPLVCYLGGLLFQKVGLQASISSYYYTNVRDVFTGILVGIGMFMITYRGYELIDDIISNATAICVFGIALFPCSLLAVPGNAIGFFNLESELSGLLHSISAGLFFILLAVNSIFIFTLTDKSKEKTREKRIRNGIFIACGIVMLAALAGIGILTIMLPRARLESALYLFILETILLEAFGVSWLVKGKTILKD